MITVEVRTNTKRIKFAEQALTRRGAINRKISIALYGIVMRNFQDEGNDGVPWAPLKAGGRWVGMKGGKGTSRFRGRRQLDTSARILQDTGALRNSFLSFYDDEVAGVGARSGAHPDAPDLAAAHEFGVPARNLPSRPMLPAKKLALEKALTIYNLAIQNIAAGKEP